MNHSYCGRRCRLSCIHTRVYIYVHTRHTHTYATRRHTCHSWSRRRLYYLIAQR